MIDQKDLHDYWNANKTKFEEIVKEIPYHSCGMWYTEAFLFCSICEILGADTILESGRAYGQSTELFTRYGFNVVSSDTCNTYGDAEEIAKNRLSKYENVKLLKGDSFTTLPNFINQNKHVKYGLFIDGPKGNHLQNKLKGSCLAENLLAVGYHDRGPEKDMYHSHTVGFITDQYSYLNERIIKEDKEQKNWLPYGPGALIEIIEK